VDEPTNHLDLEARDLLAGALKMFKGVGLLVSHDRELLDALCGQCLFLDPPEARMRPGGYTKGFREACREEEHLCRTREQLKVAEKKLKQQVAKRRSEASRSDRRVSKRGLPAKDHDAREKIDSARLTGKDAVAGRILRRTEGRLDRARRKRDGVRVKKVHEMGIGWTVSRSKRNVLFTLEQGSISLGDARRLRFPELRMQPADRIALTGRNGAGKSTLIQRIVAAVDLPEELITYVPQEIERHAAREILDRSRSLSKDKLGVMMNVVSRLGSRPERLLESEEPSPGETRKLLLALGMAHAPHLIIMDEPTNHMDLPAIRCLEEALDECPCGLLLVSHDRTFLRRLARIEWTLSPEKTDPGCFVLQMKSA
jgi:ATPase subunit of ABC transporter with duplicated ATPase domains